MTPRGLDFKKPDTERVFLAGLGGLLLSSSALRFFTALNLLRQVEWYRRLE